MVKSTNAAENPMRNDKARTKLRRQPSDISEEAVEAAARAIVVGNGAEIIASDEHWPSYVERHRQMCAEWPDYEQGRSLITDAFRNARTALGAAAALKCEADEERMSLAARGAELDEALDDVLSTWRKLLPVVMAGLADRPVPGAKAGARSALRGHMRQMQELAALRGRLSNKPIVGS
jgi:hypothetical protein